jgi:hypothetical protein
LFLIVLWSGSLDYVQEPQPVRETVVTLTQVVEELLSSIDVLTADVMRQVWGTSGYDEEHMAREDLASYLTPNLRSIVRSLPTTGTPLPEAVEAAERIGEARSLQGVPVDAVMQSWVTAEHVVLDQLLRSAERLPGGELRTAVHRLGAVISQLIRHSVDVYRRTQDEVTAHYDRLTTDLVARLTGEQPADPEEVRRRARTIGVDPTSSYAAVALSAGTTGRTTAPAAFLRAQRHMLATIGAHLPGRVLIGSVDECPLLLIPTPHGAGSLEGPLLTALADPRRPDPLLVGMSDATAPLPMTGRVCQEARDAVEVGRRLGWTDRLVRFSDVVPEVLLLRNPDIAVMLRQSLRPLLARPELLETLQAYFECGLSAREAARRLFVHPNTVPYRLRLIERLLGRDLVDMTATSDLTLALRSCALSAAADERVGFQNSAAAVDLRL